MIPLYHVTRNNPRIFSVFVNTTNVYNYLTLQSDYTTITHNILLPKAYKKLHRNN